MIRISSQQIFSGGINRLQELNSSLNQTQEQISTGKRVNKPSDDPVAAARILRPVAAGYESEPSRDRRSIQSHSANHR